jgi:hypothetical protein
MVTAWLETTALREDASKTVLMTPTAQMCKNVGPMDNARLKAATPMPTAHAVMEIAKTTFATRTWPFKFAVLAALMLLELCATASSSVKPEIQLKMPTQWALASLPNALLMAIVTPTPKPVLRTSEFALVSNAL